MRALPADSFEYFDDTADGNTAAPAAAGASGAAAVGAAGAAAPGVAAVRARHSLRKSAYFLSPTVLSAFILFHSSLQVFKRFCALAGAAENMRPAQAAAAQNATSFFMASPRLIPWSLGRRKISRLLHRYKTHPMSRSRDEPAQYHFRPTRSTRAAIPTWRMPSLIMLS